MATFVMGDIHGQTDRAEKVLTDANVIDGNGAWAAGQSTLWFVGDFFDRGPDGAGALRLARRLQDEASGEGGAVHALLGNHELMVLGVLRFGEDRSDLVNLWLTNGGKVADLRALDDDDREWLYDLPAAGLADGTLMVHCDSAFYAHMGDSVEQLNAGINEAVRGGSFEEFYELMETFFSRDELSEASQLDSLLETFSARRVIHGHTPIPIVLGTEPSSVTEPLTYADGRCTNVDGGMYMGGPGFLHQMG